MRKAQSEKFKKLKIAIDDRMNGDNLTAISLGYKNAKQAFGAMGTDFVKECRKSKHFASINKSMSNI